jgi:hypothetical protein
VDVVDRVDVVDGVEAVNDVIFDPARIAIIWSPEGPAQKASFQTVRTVLHLTE